jgi:flagellar protein FlaG
MIDRLSSNYFSSQQRSINSGQTAAETQEMLDYIQTETKNDGIEAFSLPKEKVEEIVDSINKFLEASPTALKFELHEKLNEYYVKIIDEKTKETVREIPSKKMLDIYAAMTEFIGLMVDKKI